MDSSAPQPQPDWLSAVTTGEGLADMFDNARYQPSLEIGGFAGSTNEQLSFWTFGANLGVRSLPHLGTHMNSSSEGRAVQGHHVGCQQYSFVRPGSQSVLREPDEQPGTAGDLVFLRGGVGQC